MRRGPVIELPANEAVPASVIASFIDLLEQPILISDRSGRILQANTRGRQRLAAHGFTVLDRPEFIFGPASREFQRHHQTDRGRRTAILIRNSIAATARRSRGSSGCRKRTGWWFGWRTLEKRAVPIQTAATQHTVQELLQEREITYRNLLAAYLRLQEVNRQKTVFLASAAHELKTPLAVIKGYYDLLLSGSLGKLTDKQRDILQESKESCERLVRLVSMFLNYSALESGKLVLHLRENDLRDCLSELATRWHEAFRAQARAPGHDSEYRHSHFQIRLPESPANRCQSCWITH